MIKLKDILREVINPFDKLGGTYDSGNPGSEQNPKDNVNIPALEFNLKDLTFDDVLKSFPGDYKDEQFSRTQPNGQEGPYYRDSVAFPNLSAASTRIGDLVSFEDWKKEFLRDFGDSIILLDPDAEWFDKVKIKNDKFNQHKNTSNKTISKYYSDKPSGGFTGD